MMVKLTLVKSFMMLLPVAFYEQRYKISDEGFILNLANNQPLKPTLNSNGYLKVGLANGDGTHHQELLHILVAKHFIPNPYGYKQVNHKDGNKLHCHKDNLEWCSAAQNVEHAFKTGLRPGYMSADDKEKYLFEVLAGKQVKDIAFEIGRRPETLHKMPRTTADRLGIRNEWDDVMRRNRKDVALRQLAKINS